jgi:hypothetical protein
MKNIKEYINEQFNPEWDYVIEMASIGYPILNKQKHYIALHGAHAGDRERPHIHIYLENDIRPFSKFNFEIALDEILCYDEINLIRMVDSKKHIDIRNRNKCSWEGYNKLKNDFEDWLFSNEVDLRGDYIDNLDACIYFYNQESGKSENNPLLKYIKDHGMKILQKYEKYFSKEDKEQYKECFN